MLVRSLTAEDLPGLNALLREALILSPGSFAVTPDEFDRGMGMARLDPSEIWTVAEDAGEIVGCAALFTRPSSVLSHKADVRRVYVDPRYRATGLVGMLVRAAMESRPSHVRFLRASTSSRNEGARRLAERFGFVPYAIEPASMMVDGMLVDEIWMQIDLGAAGAGPAFEVDGR